MRERGDCEGVAGYGGCLGRSTQYDDGSKFVRIARRRRYGEMEELLLNFAR